jgi:hypothetical protein
LVVVALFRDGPNGAMQRERNVNIMLHYGDVESSWVLHGPFKM